MAYNIITPSNSSSVGIADSDIGAFLLVTEGGYITNNSGGIAYSSSGGGANITIAGYVISKSYFGLNVSGGSDKIDIAESGFVSGTVGIDLHGDNTVVHNQGTVISTYASGAGIFINGANNEIENSGSISGDFGVRSFVYDLMLVNSGSIYSKSVAVRSNLGAVLENSGLITGQVSTDEALQLTNDGIINGAINAADASGGSSAITNHGTVNGGIGLGIGDDVVDTSTGVIKGIVDLGGGADTYTGGDGIDRVVGGVGNDAIDLGAGNDVYRAGNGDGKDNLDGGDGIDRYDASDATQAVTVDLSSNTTGGTVSADFISGFENITGGAAADTLTGDDGANRIDGGMGADTVNGGAGNDRLIGGTGTDTITGGAGKDVMTGGLNAGSADSDTFVFRAGDSGVTAATRDTISDFTDHGSNTAPFATGADTIDLHFIDANTGTTGDQAFSFNATAGAAFSGTAGSLIWQQYAGYALVSGDVNGDKVADFTIQLNGTHTLFASDFVL